MATSRDPEVRLLAAAHPNKIVIRHPQVSVADALLMGELMGLGAGLVDAARYVLDGKIGTEVTLNRASSIFRQLGLVLSRWGVDNEGWRA